MNNRKKWLYLFWKGENGEPDIGYGIEKRGLWFMSISYFISSFLFICVLLSYLSADIGALAIIGMGVFQYFQFCKYYGYYEVDKYGRPIHPISSGPNMPLMVKGRKLVSKSVFLREQS